MDLSRYSGAPSRRGGGSNLDIAVRYTPGPRERRTFCETAADAGRTGAVLPARPDPRRGRRLVRIVPPCVVFSLVYLAAMAASASLLQGIRTVPSLSIREIGCRLLSGSCHDHLWFVVLIVELSLIYPPRIRRGGRRAAASAS